MNGLHEESQSTLLGKVFGWIAAIAGFSFMFVVFAGLVAGAFHGLLTDVMLQHLPSIIGLPCSAIASLVIVLMLRTVSGNIELKVIGFEFKGASGPIIMWILCFLAITLAIMSCIP
jgi:uncharacterized membrane protein YeiH